MSILVNCLIAPVISMMMWAGIYLALGPAGLVIAVCAAAGGIGLVIGYVTLLSIIDGRRTARRNRAPVAG